MPRFFLRLPLLGLLALLFLSPPAMQARLVHRWSFNDPAGPAPKGTPMTDSVSGAVAFVRGVGSTFDGAALTLTGATPGSMREDLISGYVDLPNGIISSKKRLTVEIWAAPLSALPWMRVFDFGRSEEGFADGAPGELTPLPGVWPNVAWRNSLALTFSRGAGLDEQQFFAKLNNVDAVQVNTELPTVAGTQYHYVVTYEDGQGTWGNGGGLLRWYRDGVLISTSSLSFHLADLQDVNNWLGRAQHTGFQNANAAYGELRIYDHAMTAGEVEASFAAGPDAVFPAPVTRADTATLHAGQKVRVPVLANDTGEINPATVVVVQAPQSGTAVPDAAGRILYTHTAGAPATDSFSYVVSGAGGLSAAATVTVEFTAALRIANATLKVPAAPPETAVQIVPAFPALTFSYPLVVTGPPGDRQRLFVAQFGGVIKVIDDVTAASPGVGVLLDLPAMLAARGLGESMPRGPSNEAGLLGLAFHPDFAANGYFYVCYMVAKAEDPGVFYQRIARFTVRAAQRSLPVPAADPGSELVLIEQRDREDNHNGGDLHFGPDGYLYYAAGDEANPFDKYDNSQRIDLNFFSAMLRIDVDKKPGSLEPNPHPAVPLDAGVARYSVPADNPFVGATSFNGAVVDPAAVRTEFWAVGLRSPWRFSFDALNGDLWLADVGQDTYEEVDLITRAGNYGWVWREGFHPGPKSPPAGQTLPALIDPIYEYVHPNVPGGDANYKGNSVIGGVVYRGARFPSLAGAYIFGDFVTGHVWALTRPGGVAQVQRIGGLAYHTGYGTDPSNGDVLIADMFNHRLMRLITTVPDDNFPTTLGATGLFADLTDLSPAPGVLPYEPNLSFWSDHAVKRRWFAIPDGTGQMAWSRDGAWTFPDGQIWVKHFDLETERGNPASPKKRIETRVLVKNAGGCYGVSYRWNEAGTEATLVEDGGDDFSVNITVGGVPYAQPWRIPSRAQCVSCHSPQAGHALSFTTRQLNLAHTMNGFAGNQLDLLRDGGFFSNPPEATGGLPRHVRPDDTAQPLEDRARSYLAVNCAYCHAGASGTAPAQWDGRAHLTLAQTGLVNGTPASNGGNPLNKLIVPGDPAHSVVLNRVAAANGFTRMPPLGSSELDQTNIALLTAWITDGISYAPPAPGTPAAAGSGANVALSWTDHASNEEGFSIEVSTDGSAFFVAAVTGANVENHTAGPLDPGVVYYFRVKAFNSFNTQTYSAPTPVVAAHANVTAEATGPTGAVVNYDTVGATSVAGVTSLAYSQESGSVFPIGVTTVTSSATDAASHVATATFTVTVRDTTGPVVLVPANIVVEATGAAGAAVSFAVSASDAVDGAVDAIPDHASGSTFPLGTTTVLVAASDTRTNVSTASFTVTVLDTTAPMLAAHSNVLAEATGALGALVNYAAATAADAVTATPAIAYSQESGTRFPIGVTTVTITATDAAGNVATGTFTVTVRDTTGPVVLVPANIVVEATGAAGAAVSFAVSASDAVDGAVDAIPDHASGSTFPLGTTTVLVAASDTRTNVSTASFTVTVLDTTAPMVTPPANVTMLATSPSGALVSYPMATAADAVGVVALSYSQNSGTLFPIGTTTVTATATDAANNTGTAIFTVTVLPLSALQSWRFAHYGIIANSGDAADTADPYQTGLPNLLLFAFFDPNLDLSQAHAGLLPQVQMAGGSLFFSFTEPVGISGITYGAESNTTLQLEDWQALPDTGHDTLHIFSVPIGDNPQLFLRLRVTAP